MKYLGQQKCTTCRLRKLKCDNDRPICGPCSKSARRCVFAASSVFRYYDTSSASLENARFSKRIRSTSSHYPDVIEQERLYVPSQLIFIHTDSGTFDDSALETPSPPPRVHDYDIARTSTPDVYSSTIATANRDVTSPNDRVASISAPAADVVDEIGLAPSDFTVWQIRLLEHFRRVPGQWMDLFDANNFFSVLVSTTAASQPIILLAACAVAAKHVYQLRVPRPGWLDSSTAIACLYYSSSATEDGNLGYESVRFYDMAIKHVKQALSRDPPDLISGSETISSEDVLAVVAILSMYELMDAPGMEWRAHLGALPLLDEPPVITPSFSPGTSPRMKALARKSLFWTFARQDVMSAFIHETQTYLNLDNADLWRRFGLRTEDFGIHIPHNEEPSHFSPPPTQWNELSLPEIVMSNSMIWLLGRIINFTTSGDSIDPKEYALPVGLRPIIAVPQEALLELWKQLERQLQKWYDSLPATFTPAARIQAGGISGRSLEKIYYHIPMCAAAMQSYHMAYTILLVNRPQESTAIRSTVTSRMRSYKEIQKRALEHSREICGISLAEPPDSVRVNSLQPLFVAGQCFDDTHDQQLVIDLLVNVEKDLGWRSEYYVDKLRAQWNQAD